MQKGQVLIRSIPGSPSWRIDNATPWAFRAKVKATIGFPTLKELIVERYGSPCGKGCQAHKITVLIIRDNVVIL